MSQRKSVKFAPELEADKDLCPVWDPVTPRRHPACFRASSSKVCSTAPPSPKMQSPALKRHLRYTESPRATTRHGKVAREYESFPRKPETPTRRQREEELRQQTLKQQQQQQQQQQQVRTKSQTPFTFLRNLCRSLWDAQPRPSRASESPRELESPRIGLRDIWEPASP